MHEKFYRYNFIKLLMEILSSVVKKKQTKKKKTRYSALMHDYYTQIYNLSKAALESFGDWFHGD